LLLAKLSNLFNSTLSCR